MSEEKYSSLRPIWEKYGITPDLFKYFLQGEVVCDEDQKCQDPVYKIRDNTQGYQNWKNMLRQRSRGLYGQLIGPSSISLWIRPFDARQVLIIGQNTQVNLEGTAPDFCYQSVVFLRWFRQVIEPQKDKWSIIMPGETPKFSLDPISALYVYNKEYNLNLGISDVEKSQLDPNFATSLFEGGIGNYIAMDVWLAKLFERYQSSFEKKGHHMTQSDMKHLVHFFEFSKTHFLRDIDASDRENKTKLEKRVRGIVCGLQILLDITAFLFAMLSTSLKKNVMILLSENERHNLESVIPLFGFQQIYPTMAGWRRFVQRPSCTVMPRLDTELKEDPSLPINYIIYTIPLTCDVKEAEEKIKEKIPLILKYDLAPIPMDIQVLLRGLTAQQIRNIGLELKVDQSQLDALIERLTRGGLLSV